MADRRTYLYRLNVQFPPGSDEIGWEPNGWSDDPEHTVQDPETGGYETADFSWPAVRAYLSQTAANRRAALLRSYGAVVTVERSEPIAWPASQMGAVVPDIPQEVVQAAAEVLERGDFTDKTFAGYARAVLEAAIPLLPGTSPTGPAGQDTALAELIEKALREHLRILPQERAVATLQAGRPISLSGREAEDAARIALGGLAGAGLAVSSVCACGQPIGTCHSCDRPRCWHCHPGLGKHYQPMACNERHEPALPERGAGA